MDSFMQRYQAISKVIYQGPGNDDHGAALIEMAYAHPDWSFKVMRVSTRSITISAYPMPLTDAYDLVKLAREMEEHRVQYAKIIEMRDLAKPDPPRDSD